VKNCGDYVHFQIAEKKILEEMIKIIKKKVSLILVKQNGWPFRVQAISDLQQLV
jgi:hypothetical protein